MHISQILLPTVLTCCWSTLEMCVCVCVPGESWCPSPDPEREPEHQSGCFCLEGEKEQRVFWKWRCVSIRAWGKQKFWEGSHQKLCFACIILHLWLLLFMYRHLFRWTLNYSILLALCGRATQHETNHGDVGGPWPYLSLHCPEQNSQQCQCLNYHNWAYTCKPWLHWGEGGKSHYAELLWDISLAFMQIPFGSIMSHLLYLNRTKVSEGEAHPEEELTPHRHLYWKLYFVSWMFPAQGLCWLLWPQAAKSPSCSGAPTTAGSPEPAAAPFLPRLGKPHLAQRLGKTQLTLRDSPAHPLLLLVPLPHLFLCL